MTDSLRAHLKWLGIEDCTCERRWASLGVLYGISMGKGWVRTSTDPNCPHHGTTRKQHPPSG